MAVSALTVAGRLGAASDALAALGALIRIETEGLDADPEVRAAHLGRGVRRAETRGWLIGGTFAAAGPDRLAELLMDLRTVRSGGKPWTATDLLPRLAAAGYQDTGHVSRTWAAPVHLYLGRRAL